MSSIYTDSTLYANNKLGMINQCLSTIGQRPLVEGTQIESLPVGSEARVAGDIVTNVMKEIQAKGWYFNTDINFKFLPDSYGFIAVPPSLLRIDVGNTKYRKNIVLRGNRFYNRESFSYIFTTEIYADAVWLIDYELLPFTAYQYIALRSARLFQQKFIGSEDLTVITLKEEEEALETLEREQLQYEDINLVDVSFNRTKF